MTKNLFFGLGVPRSGSTSLSKYLSTQYDVNKFNEITDFCEIEFVNKDIVGTIFNKGSK